MEKEKGAEKEEGVEKEAVREAEMEVVAMVLEGYGTKAVKGTWPVTGDAFDHAVTLVTPVTPGE